MSYGYNELGTGWKSQASSGVGILSGGHWICKRRSTTATGARIDVSLQTSSVPAVSSPSEMARVVTNRGSVGKEFWLSNCPPRCACQHDVLRRACGVWQEGTMGRRNRLFPQVLEQRQPGAPGNVVTRFDLCGGGQLSAIKKQPKIKEYENSSKSTSKSRESGHSSFVSHRCHNGRGGGGLKPPNYRTSRRLRRRKTTSLKVFQSCSSKSLARRP